MIPYADGGTPPQAGGRTGLERELDIGGGVSVMIDPYGSFRFVLNGPDGPISALQVMSEDGRTGHVAGVFTRPEFRRRGYASLLLARAASMFPDLQFDEDQSPLGQVWTEAQPQFELPEPTAPEEPEHLARVNYALTPSEQAAYANKRRRQMAAAKARYRERLAGLPPEEALEHVRRVLGRRGTLRESRVADLSGLSGDALQAALEHGLSQGHLTVEERRGEGGRGNVGRFWSLAAAPEPEELSRYERVPTAYMTTEDDFQRMLDENPHDAHTRLILADFLDDMGDPRAAGYRALGMLGHSPHAASENGAPLFIWGRSDNSAVRTYHPPMALDPEWMLATQSTHSHYPNEQWWRHHNTRREAEEQAALAFATLTPERQARILSNAQQLSRYERRHAPTAFDYDDRQYRRGQFIPGTVMFTHSPAPVEYADPPFPPPQDDPNNWATPRTDVQPNWAFWPTPDVQPAESPRPVDPQPANSLNAPDEQPATTDAPTFDYAHHPMKRFLSTHPTVADELITSGSGANVSRKITYDPNHPDSGGALHAAIFKPRSGEASYISRVVAPGTYFRREAASSEIADALGMHDIFPPAAIRHHEDDVGSAQYWINGAEDAYDLPPSQRYGDPRDLARAASLDYLLGNHDRHPGNWKLLTRPVGPHKLQLIDHGLVLPNDHLTDRSEGFDTWRAQTNVLLAKAGLDNLPIPEGLAGKWPHIEHVLRSHGIEDRAIELARQRYEALTGGNYRTIGELPAWWDSQMNVPDALGAQFHRWDI